jgi:hypothetical protein
MPRRVCATGAFAWYFAAVATADWKKFEELAASIQAELAPDAIVTANAKLLGKSGTLRQIDVLIEHEAGQYKLRIVVDCKDYKHPVDVKAVEAFLGLIQDVGAHKGAMVAANGFTRTAKIRAREAGLDLFRVIDTADHKWRTYVSIPALSRDFQLESCSFSISWKGYGALDIRQDHRFMPIFRPDGSLIDYAGNLVLDRWEDETVPVATGEHRGIPLTTEATFLKSPDGRRFEVTIRANVCVKEVIHFGQMPLVDVRGFKSELEDITHIHGMTTAPWNFERISREWQRVDSVEQLAVKPVMRLTVKSSYPRYEGIVPSRDS